MAGTHAQLKAAMPSGQRDGRHDFDAAIAQLLAEVRDCEPFKGENKTYQPFYGIDMPGWTFVRGDSLARFGIMSDALAKCPRWLVRRRWVTGPPMSTSAAALVSFVMP